MVEANPLAGLENNVLGTYVVAQAALNAKVDNMVLIQLIKQFAQRMLWELLSGWLN
jgi:hypothetical protein